MRRAVVIVGLWIGVVACGGPADDTPAGPDAGPGQPDASSYEPPRTDLVPRVGSDDALDIATWNIENFPLMPSTPRLVADLIASMDLDVIALQEIEDIASFEELVARLPGYKGILSNHTYGNGTYQKVAFIYRTDVVEVGPAVLLFDNNGYEFPRPPLQVIMTAGDLEFVAITLHLKAGGGDEDKARREVAIEMLEDHVRGSVEGSGDDEILMLGDFNERIDTSDGAARFEPFLGDPAAYEFHTDTLPNGAASFIPSGRVIDHVISTVGLAEEMSGGLEQIPALQTFFNAYTSAISDHLPVVVSMPIL